MVGVKFRHECWRAVCQTGYGHDIHPRGIEQRIDATCLVYQSIPPVRGCEGRFGVREQPKSMDLTEDATGGGPEAPWV